MTVLRAAMIIGSGSASFEIMRYLVQRLPVMITPTWVSTRCQPIAIENVLGYLVGVLSSADTTGEVFDIGGREILSYRDIMHIMAEELDLPRRWILPVPLLTPRLSSHWIQLVTPLSHRIARPLAEGLKNEVICRDDRITRLIPQARLDVREAIHAALSQVKAHLVEPTGRWPVRCQVIRTGPAAPSSATCARLPSRCLPARSFERSAGSAGSAAGTPAGSGGSGAGSISERVDLGCAGAVVIPISCVTATPRLLACGRYRTGSFAVLARRDETAGPGAPGLSGGSRWGFEVHALPDRPLRASGPGRIALSVRRGAVSRRRLSDDARRHSA